MNKLILSIVFCFIFIKFSNGQSPRIKFEHISLEQGLSQSSVKSILQDSRGFMWFATIDGLNKYDGYKIKVYEPKLNKTGSISDNVLNVLYEANDENGSTLWVGTAANGLCRYNKTKDNFDVFRNDSKNQNSLSSDVITAICGDNKILWVGTDNGLNRFDISGNRFSVFKHADNNPTTLADNYIKYVCFDKSGTLWIATKTGLHKLDVKTNQITQISKSQLGQFSTLNCIFIDTENILWLGSDMGLIMYKEQPYQNKVYKNIPNDIKSISDNKVNSIVEDAYGILWIGTENGGLNRFDKQKNEFFYYKHDPSDVHSLSTNNIFTIYQSKSKILWIGTSLGGINKWNRAADELQVFRHNPYDDNSLSSNQVRNIYEDKKGQIWIGTVDGGLNRWDVVKNRFVHYLHNPLNPLSISHNHVRSILHDRQGNYWIATDGGGINRFDTILGTFERYTNDSKNPNSISDNRVWKIIEDSKNNIWVATHGGGLCKFDSKVKKFTVYRHKADDKTTISSNLTTTVFEDSKGILWVGTFEGLNKMDLQNGTFQSYQYNKDDTSSISNNRIYSIIEDADGEIWIGTKGGLNHFNQKTEKFERFTTENTDFPNNVMMGIIDDGKGNLWISNNRGIAKFNKKTKKVRVYDVRDGLQSNEFLANAFCKTRKGEFFFGGINGFNAFFPEKIIDNPNIPSLAITGFRISNSDLILDTTITEKKIIYLEYYQNDISFDFVALDFIFPEKNQYAYKLIGYDKDWQNVKYARTAKYTNLSPKKYIFKVKGSNNDEVWNEKGVELIVVIKPAFWQTTWFQVSATLIILFSISLTVWLRFRAIKKRNEHLEHLVQIRTAEVVKQKEEIQAKNDVLEEQKKEIEAKNSVLQQQKEEIEAQRDEIEAQRDLVTQQRDEISHQKKDIVDSIEYAKRIQTAALPGPLFLSQIMPEHFILFKPRDIVSGDFYWASFKNGRIVVTAADCTGHGVPGAFMSMLGMSFLNNIVNEQGITEPDKILNELRANVIKSLHQQGVAHEAKDGMDICLCSIDLQNQMLEYSGAYNPLYFIRNKEAEVLKADDMPIAIYDLMNPFTKHEHNIQKGDVVYMFSDGYADQFGGEKGKKFMTKRFRELLIEISDKPMYEQKDILNSTIEEWKAFPDKHGHDTFMQVDDILIFGVRF